MTVRVDFLEGVDIGASGTTRALRPLAEALKVYQQLEIHELRYSTPDTRLLFPFVYGALPPLLALRRSNLLHVGNAWYGHLTPLVPRPTVVTCHDLIELEELEDGERRPGLHRRFHIRAAFHGMAHARFIVCVSAATAERVLKRAPHLGNRVRVIHSGISPAFTAGSGPEPPQRRIISGPYVLYVGSEQPRKNLDRLVTAIARVRGRIPDLSFVKVGAHQTPEGRDAFLAALRRENLLQATVIVDSASDAELARLYRGASVTALVSLREGFGFPPLEAMACGCPAIVSNRGSLAEIAGDAALLVNPLDPRSIASAIERVLCDAPLQEELVERGRRRAATFTWARAATAYAALYDQALQPR